MPRDPDLDRLFPDLVPPPGGLQRLRARLDARDERRPALPRWTWALPPVAAAVAALLLTIRPPAPPSAPRALPPAPFSSPALVRLGLEALPSAAVTVPPEARDHVSIQAVPVATEGVIYYRVDVLSPPGT